MPNNCNECPHTNTCQRYYGARGCAYHNEILKAIIAQHEREERKRQYEEKD